MKNKVAVLRRGIYLLDDEKQPGFSNQTIQRVGTILRCFVESNTEMGVNFISRKVDIHKSTVSRMLSALRREGFVEQNPETGKWRLGIGLLSLAGVVLDRMDLRKAAMIPLRLLVEQTQETINIAVLDNNECVNIESIQSPKPIQYAGRLGRRTPLHCTSTGKVLLAFLPPKKQESLLSGTLSSCTKKSIIEKSTLEQVLNQVRKEGYAVAHEEFEEGLSAIAAPIRDHTGQVVATVSISGPTYRIGPGKIENFVKPLLEAANKISTNLGYMTT
jgi:DNA-binding IclR family transcriptional regulator